jgi:hypothetical protein
MTRLRPNEMQPTDDKPKQPVVASHRDPTLRTQRHVQLLAQQQVLKDWGSAVPGYRGKRTDEQDERSVIAEA